MSRLLVTTECHTNVTRDSIIYARAVMLDKNKSSAQKIKISSAVLRDLDKYCQTAVS